MEWAPSMMTPPGGKCDGVVGHISECENGHWLKIIALLPDRSLWHLARLGKLDVSMNW